MCRTCLLIVLLVLLATPVRAADLRLAQKITYQGGGKRLHAVAEDLTKQTGVTIRAGENKQDWRVRDIPLIVCVKDMPLGKLLQAVANCAHVTFGAERIAGAKDDKPGYRLYRTKKQQDDVMGTLDRRADANRKLATWAWDTLAAYSKLPDATIPVSKPDGWNEIDGTQARLVANVMGSLPDDLRTKAISGEQVSIDIGAHPKSPALQAIYDYALTHSNGAGPRAVLEPNEEQRGQSMIALRMCREERPNRRAGFYFIVYGVPVALPQGKPGAYYMDSWQADPVALAKTVASVKKLELSPPPDVDSVLSGDDTFPDSHFNRLKTDEDWKSAPLQRKAALSLPKTDSGRQAVTDVLGELSKTSGLNVIAEDFITPRSGGRPTARVDASTSATIGSVLKASMIFPTSEDWFLNADNKCAVGWIKDWRKHHLALVPESLIAGIRARCEGQGAEIDDIAPVVDLSREQIQEWFCEGFDFMGVQMVPVQENVAVWRLYSALSLEDKQLAKSKDGLPLAKFDSVWLVKLIQQAQSGVEDHIVHTSPFPSQDSKRKIVGDAKQIRQMTMKLQSWPLTSWGIYEPEGSLFNPRFYTPGPNGPSKHAYVIWLFGPSEGGSTPPGASFDLPLGGYGSLAFPIFTPEREAELRKNAETKEKK